MVQRFLKSASVVVGLLASVFLGIPLAGFGLTGLAGRLADADYATNFYGGLQLLGTAAGIWIAFFACWLWWMELLPKRFGLRSLLLATSVVAVFAGLISALLRMANGS
jgi:hypothetical protein